MTGFVPKEMLTAYQRWEVAAFDEERQEGERAEESRSAQGNDNRSTETADQTEQTPVALPTAAEIERMHIEAHQQGFASGHAEGLAEARAGAAKINALMTSLQQSLRGLDQHVADQLLATALEVASQEPARQAGATASRSQGGGRHPPSAFRTPGACRPS